MTEKPLTKKPLSERELDQVQGGFAPLKPAEFETGKPHRNPGFYLPEVDDEVIV